MEIIRPKKDLQDHNIPLLFLDILEVNHTQHYPILSTILHTVRIANLDMSIEKG